MKKKYNLSMVLAAATLIFGGCKNDNNVDIVEVASSEVEVTQDLTLNSEEIKELVDADDNEEMIEVENELIAIALSNSGSSSNNGSSSNSGSSSNNGSSSNSSSSSNNGTTSNSGSSSNNGTTSNSGSTTPSNPTPPVVEQPKPQKPVDILDWNYIKSTLISKGQSLGMIYEPSMNRELDGWESPWQSSYMPVTNEDVIGYIGTKMERCANSSFQYFNLEMVVQADGNVLIYLIR